MKKIMISNILIGLLLTSSIVSVNGNVEKSEIKQKTVVMCNPIVDICGDSHDFILINMIHDIDANVGLKDSLYVDKDFIWAGTYNGTVYMYDRENFSLIHKIQPFDYIAGIRGDDNFVYILGYIYGEDAAIYIYKYERCSMNLIKQSDSLPDGYGFFCISMDVDFIYVGERSIDVDDKYIYYTCLNNYPIFIYNKQLSLMEQLPSQTGLNIFYKETYTLIKFIQYEQIQQVPNIYCDDTYLYTAHHNGSVSIYEKNNFNVVITLIREGQDYANTVSSDSSYIYVGRESFKINVYNKNNFVFITDLNSSGYLSEFRTISTYDNYIYGGTSLTPKIFIYRYERAPEPPTITGPTAGKIDVEYNYTSMTVDIDDDYVYYWFDWGDGTNTGWLGPYTSGGEIIQSHTWSKKGIYTIKIKAKDIFGRESGWGTLSVTMPYSYNIPFLQFWMKLFERFPNAFPILRHLLGY